MLDRREEPADDLERHVQLIAKEFRDGFEAVDRKIGRASCRERV